MPDRGNFRIQNRGHNHRVWKKQFKILGTPRAALWYLGENNINTDVMRRIEEGLSEREFETLRSSRMPAWMSEAFRQYEAGRVHD